MAFGLTQWFISFGIFLIIMTVITWSAIHLGKKEQNATNIILRFFDADDYSVEWKNKSLYSTIVLNSTSQVVESTDGSTLFPIEQGSEIPDSAQFYKIIQTFYSNESNVVTNSDITDAISPSIVGNDSSWNDDIMLHNTSDRIFVFDNRRNISEKITISPHHISQTAHSAHLTHKATSFEMDKLWTSDLSQSAETELSKLPQDEKNSTSNTSVTFSFSQTRVSDTDSSNTTEQMKIMRII